MQLIPVTEQHLPLIEKWHADKRIYNFLNNGEPIDVALDLNSFPESGPVYARIVEHGGNAIGLATFYSKDEYAVNPVYFLDPSSQGQGLGKQMVQAIIDFLVGRGVKYIYGSTNELNYPAWKVLYDLGYKFCGYRPGYSRMLVGEKVEFAGDIIQVWSSEPFSPELENLHNRLQVMVQGKTEEWKGRYREVRG